MERFEPLSEQIRFYKKVRKTWEINPQEKVKQNKPKTNRFTKQDERYLIEEALDELHEKDEDEIKEPFPCEECDSYGSDENCSMCDYFYKWMDE